MSDNPLWAMIQQYMDNPMHRYPPKPADLARECNLSPQVLSKWKQRPTLPEPEQLIRLAVGTGIPYLRLLEAALAGKRYIQQGYDHVVTPPFLNAETRDLLKDTEGNPRLTAPKRLDAEQQQWPDNRGQNIAARRGRPGLRNSPQDTAGEESQDDGGVEPL